MKKVSLLLLGLTLMGVVSVDIANAASWPFCFKDTNYTPQYQVELSNGVIRGQAIGSDSSFPAPITGYISGGVAYFAIAYLNTNLRFYVISAIDKGEKGEAFSPLMFMNNRAGE